MRVAHVVAVEEVLSALVLRHAEVLLVVGEVVALSVVVAAPRHSFPATVFLVVDVDFGGLGLGLRIRKRLGLGFYATLGLGQRLGLRLGYG